MVTAAQKILQLLRTADRPMSPSEIARSTKLKPNIARARLSELRKKGEVQRKFRGYYECNPTYDVGFHTPPRVQNLRVTAKEVPITVSDVYERVVRNLRIRITFGVKRGKISYTVKASKGLDLDGLRLCHALVNTECEVRGYSDLILEARNYELLWDHVSVRLEGVQAVTWSDLEGALEKYYNKDNGLRRELRISEPRSIQDLEALIQGGVTANTVLQGLNVLSHDISSLVDAVKGIQYSYSEMIKLFKEEHASLIRLVDKIDEMSHE